MTENSEHLPIIKHSRFTCHLFLFCFFGGGGGGGVINIGGLVDIVELICLELRCQSFQMNISFVNTLSPSALFIEGRKTIKPVYSADKTWSSCAECVKVGKLK